MNLYADTSALVKKDIREAGSEQVLADFEPFPVIGTASLTQLELAAALARAARLGWVSAAEARQAWLDFLTHWPAYLHLPVTNATIERAAALTWRYPLRAYDSLHLASALAWKELSGGEVTFACFDRQLQSAARQAGL